MDNLSWKGVSWFCWDYPPSKNHSKHDIVLFFSVILQRYPRQHNRLAYTASREEQSLPVGRIYRGLTLLAFFLLLACKTLHLFGPWPYHCFRLHTGFQHRSGEMSFNPPMRGSGQVRLRAGTTCPGRDNLGGQRLKISAFFPTG